MEKGLSILEQINKAFWRKKEKEVEPITTDVVIDDVCLDRRETGSEYWSTLSSHKNKGECSSGSQKNDVKDEIEDDVLSDTISKKSLPVISTDGLAEIKEKRKNSAPAAQTFNHFKETDSEDQIKPSLLLGNRTAGLKPDEPLATEPENKKPKFKTRVVKKADDSNASNSLMKMSSEVNNVEKQSIETNSPDAILNSNGTKSPIQFKESKTLMETKLSKEVITLSETNSNGTDRLNEEITSLSTKGFKVTGSRLRSDVSSSEKISKSLNEADAKLSASAIPDSRVKNVNEAGGGLSNGVMSSDAGDNLLNDTDVRLNSVAKSLDTEIKKTTERNKSEKKLNSDGTSHDSRSRKTSESSRIDRRLSSGATSPDYGSRRDSGVTSPLSFDSIQEKIILLSRDSSVAEVYKKKKVTKVKKLDENLLAAVKEPLQSKSVEIKKVAPKIDSVLQSKIRKFGEPSSGAKIPVKKAMTYSALGGLSIKEEEPTSAALASGTDKSMTPKPKHKLKPKAPQPPLPEALSTPTTPSSDRKTKKIKAKAPLPPTPQNDPPISESGGLSSLSNEVSDLLKETEQFSKQIQDFSLQKLQKDEDSNSLKSNVIEKEISNEAGLSHSTSSKEINDKTSKEEGAINSIKQGDSNSIKSNGIENEIPNTAEQSKDSSSKEGKEGVKSSVNPLLSKDKVVSNDSKFKEHKKEILIKEDVNKNSNSKEVEVKSRKTVLNSVKSTKNEEIPLIDEFASIKLKKFKIEEKEPQKKAVSNRAIKKDIVKNSNLSSMGSQLINQESVTDLSGHNTYEETCIFNFSDLDNINNSNPMKETYNFSGKPIAELSQTTFEKGSLKKSKLIDPKRKFSPSPPKPSTSACSSDLVPYVQNGSNSNQIMSLDEFSKNFQGIPDIIQSNTIDYYEDFDTPKASRKLLCLYNEGNDSRSQWREVLEESRRVQDELGRLTKRLATTDSSGSESFHTPSPRPFLYTARGEVIPEKPETDWTPSPERQLFTPEGSPLSDFSDASYDHYVASVDFSVRSVSVPRRVYPQIPRPSSYHEDWKVESPIVYDAGLSFDLCSRRTPVRQHLKPSPAFSEPKTASNTLSCKIAEFLTRTDHVMEEWRRIGRADPYDLRSLVELPVHRVTGAARSKSAANIMIKGFQYFSRGTSKSSWRSPSVSKYSECSDRTLADLEELNEMTADLTEERLNGAQAAERLDAETSERIRLEQELSQVSSLKNNLEQATERMELELHYAKNYDNALSDGDDLIEGRDENDVYKRKCARLKRENEMLKQQLRQQHEDDLEQLVGLKKQLEKRLADANEEIDEQRQVAAEWKRKSQKLQAELNDFRIIVEEQNSRNSMLEKKQRKFDAEIQMLQDEIRSEKNAKDRLARDRDGAVSSKCTMEQTLASIRSELELKEEEVRRLTRELDEMSFGGATEQDIAQLKKSKHDLEKKIKEQDDELDDLAGQVSLLESAKLKLEMSLESIRKEHRREISQKEEEIEEARSNAIKKLKGLEATLEQEYEERSLLLRGKHELERRLKDIEDQGRSTRAADEDALVRLRKDLRKTKALLRDAQAMLDRAKEDSHSKTTLRALKNQLEDSEMAKESALKAKQKLTLELHDVTGQLEDAQRLKSEAECKAQAASRNVSTLMTQLEENEEELSELMKKYNQHLSTEEMRASEAASALADVEAERNSLREQLAEATARLESMTVPDPAPDANQRRLEITIQDLKTRLDLDGAVRKRLEVQISRLKEKIDRLTEESNQHQAKEMSNSDQMRKLQVSLREAKEQIAIHAAREQDLTSKKRDLEKRLEVAELTASAARAEVKLSAQRVEDLQAALTAEISESEETSDGESG